MISWARTRWQALLPVTRVALLWAPVVCLGVNLALPRLPWQPQQMTSLDYTAAWLSGIAHSDSWSPMRMALAYLDGADLDALSEERAPGPAPSEVDGGRAAAAEPERGDRLLYEEVFFERGVKLQYPPTSLLLVDALRRMPFRSALFPDRDPTSDAALNALSWAAVLATVLLSAAILVAAAGRFAVGGAAPGPVDRALLALVGVLAGLTFYPLVRGYYLGQVQTFIDALSAGLVLAWLVGRQATAGVLAGAICLIKPQLGLLVLWAALRGRWRFAAGFAATAALAVTVSLLAYGLAVHVDYLDVLSFIGRHGEGFHPNQSVNGLLNRMLGVGNNLDWAGSRFAPYDPRVYWPTLASSLLLVGFALFYRRRAHERAPAIDLAIAIVSITIASPVAWTHHYAVLLPVFALAVPAVSATARRSAWALLGVSYLLIADNFRALNRLADTPLNFLQSYVFFGGLLLLVLLYRLRGAHAGVAVHDAA